MRCVSCDKSLNDFESTRKCATTGKYLDMCNRCFDHIKYDIPTIDREDLKHDELSDEELETLFEDE